MPFWREVDEALDVSGTLGALDDRQAEAAVSVLVMTVHADARVVPLEVAALNHMLFDLPGLESRHEAARQWVSNAAKRAESARSDQDLRAMADEAVATLADGELREKIFSMAVALARVDMSLVPAESKALLLLSDAFEIPAPRAQELIDSGYR